MVLLDDLEGGQLEGLVSGRTPEAHLRKGFVLAEQIGHAPHVAQRRDGLAPIESLGDLEQDRLTHSISEQVRLRRHEIRRPDAIAPVVVVCDSAK